MTSYQEIERKYDVGDNVITPPLHELGTVARVSQPVVHALDSTYYDTEALDLAAAKTTLRRRTGGEDAGWHLKLPGSGDEREEMRHPLADEDAVPDELLGRVKAQVRDQSLLPVARIRTRRIVRRLLGNGDQVLAEFCDDEVTAERLPGNGESQAWREWELELVTGSIDLLDQAERVFLDAGAQPATRPSKLARVLGDVPEPAGPGSADADSSAGRVFVAYVGAMVDSLREHDPLVRADAPDAVHQMRVATRRLRSVLATYRSILRREETDPLRDELKWLAGELTAARDSEVIRVRLDALLATQPAELVLGHVAARIDQHLREWHRSGVEQAHAALDSPRYLRLLDRLGALVDGQLVTAESEAPAAKALPHLLHRDWKRMRKRIIAVDEAADRTARDLAVHEVRKAAKRLRYAADSTVEALGNRAEKLSELAESVQDILGEHQDTAVSRALLRNLGVQAHLDGDNGFSYGRLHALEEARSDQLRADYAAVLPGLPPKKLKRWLRS